MYTKVSFYTADEELRNIIIAILISEGYEGFEETDDAVAAYIPADNFDSSIPEQLAGRYELRSSVNNIEKQNWNEDWERNFQPVVVDGFCTVRAGFHDISVSTPHEIIITPKMSFGTGHHATTYLVLKKMEGLDFSGKAVLDFGTGTGILSILAEMLGASDIVAVDNDEWSFLNAKENYGLNACKKINLLQGSLEDVPQKPYDIILANINRHILLQYMAQLSQLLAKGGTLLLSGILKEDKEVILQSATSAGLEKLDIEEMSNWLVISLGRQ